MKSRTSKLVLAIAWIACACTPEVIEPLRPKHVVLVVLESVRADHVGAYGYPRPTTPHLDELAAKSVVYERAYAGSSSGPQSLSTLWTGRLPSSGGSIGLREATPHPALLTLPRLFLRAGFRTGLVSNHAALRERAFTRGFDDIEVDSVPGRWNGEQVTHKALDIVDQASGDPLFLVVDYADAAEPYLPFDAHRRRIDVPVPTELLSLPVLRRSAGAIPIDIEDSPGFLDLIARYDAEIAYVDECLGELIEGFSVRGLLDDTLLLVTSSHGTEFLEHGYVGHAWTLYEEVLRVPLVVHSPTLIAPGRIGQPVSLADVVPSLQQICGLERGSIALDGQALFDAETEGLSPCTPRGKVIAELVIPELCILRTLIDPQWKLIDAVKWTDPKERLELAAGYNDIIARMQDGELERPDPWGAFVRRELYDLSNDRWETRNVAATSTEQLRALLSSLELYADICRTSGLTAKEAERRATLPDEDVSRRLQQLGYL